MSVRRGTYNDIARMVAMMQRYYEDDGRPVDDDRPLGAFCIQHVCDEDKICFVAGDPFEAFITGIVQPHYHSGVLTAFKTLWLSSPGKSGHGAKLIKPFETWARERGAGRIILSARNGRTSRLLEHRGYVPLEMAFDKELN